MIKLRRKKKDKKKRNRNPFKWKVPDVGKMRQYDRYASATADRKKADYKRIAIYGSITGVLLIGAVWGLSSTIKQESSAFKPNEDGTINVPEVLVPEIRDVEGQRYDSDVDAAKTTYTDFNGNSVKGKYQVDLYNDSVQMTTALTSKYGVEDFYYIIAENDDGSYLMSGVNMGGVSFTAHKTDEVRDNLYAYYAFYQDNSAYFETDNRGTDGIQNVMSIGVDEIPTTLLNISGTGRVLVQNALLNTDVGLYVTVMPIGQDYAPAAQRFIESVYQGVEADYERTFRVVELRTYGISEEDLAIADKLQKAGRPGILLPSAVLAEHSYKVSTDGVVS